MSAAACSTFIFADAAGASFDFSTLVVPGEDSVLDTYFPLGDGDVMMAGPSARARPSSAASAPRPPIPPASVHAIYHTVDCLGHLPNEYATILTAASSFLHLHPNLISAQVENYERRLVRIADSQRKSNNT